MVNNSRKLLRNLLPKINSKEFKKLHYKEQLFILQLFYHDKSKYTELCGSPSKELEYVDSSIDDVFRLSTPPESDLEVPVSFAEECWCAYLSFYKSTWWEEGFSPVDDLGLSHRRLFGIQLFNFPLVSFDTQSFKILRWLSKQPKKTRELNDIFYYLIKLRAAWQYFRDEDDDQLVPADVWNLSVAHLNSYVTVEEINGSYPVTEDSKLIDLVEGDTLVPLFSQVRGWNMRYYMPLVPSELYLQSQFKIKGWDFLARR